MSSVYITAFIFILLLTVAVGKDKGGKEKSKKRVKPNKRDVYLLLEHVKSPMKQNCSDPSLVPSEEDTAEIMAKLCEVPGGIGIFPRNRPCSFFLKDNMEEVVRTTNFLMDIEDYDDFMKTSTVLRSVVNEEIYVFAFTTAILNRPDTCTFQPPPIEEVLPQWFFSTNILNEAKDEVSRLSLQNDVATATLTANFGSTGVADPTEACLAYFREDISFNAHHWNWHLLNPSMFTPRNNTFRDRRGELFSYLHEQIIARYDADRFSCGLPRVIPYNLQGPILEEYIPTLLTNMTLNFYPGRTANATVQDNPSTSLWMARLLNSTSNGMFRRINGTQERFLDPIGIDYLGALVEPNSLSINSGYYGSLHNLGHVVIARASNVNNPQGDFGVMGFTSTAVRDPVFYRWHKVIDDLFNRYKMTLPPYTAQELAFPSITILSLNMRANNSATPNIVQTFLQEREIDVSRGIDFTSSNPVVITIRHLQHEQFTHNIEVNSRATTAISVTVRIFIAPKFDEQQRELTLADQRRLFIELDRFNTMVNPGRQVLTRQSIDSSVTIPTQKGFSQLSEAPAQGATNSTQQIYCGCGWPDHLLLPKGQPSGMTFTYFAMLTDGADYTEPSLTSNVCSTAASYCGVLNQRYPDVKPMGYPFDRPISSSFLRASDFAARRSNMRVSEIVIRHTTAVADKDGVFLPDSGV